MALSEVRPHEIRDVDLRIGELPEQEVRDAGLGARPDQQVGVREVGLIEMRSEIALAITGNFR